MGACDAMKRQGVPHITPISNQGALVSAAAKSKKQDKTLCFRCNLPAGHLGIYNGLMHLL
jgi:hypothetical protein